MNEPVLMLVNTVAADPVHDAGGRRRVDHRLVAEALHAEVLDLTVVRASLAGRLVQRLAGNYVALAATAFFVLRRRSFCAVLCDNENEALVLAGLLKLSGRRVPLVTLAINPVPRKKAVFFLVLRVQTHVSMWLSHNTLGLERLLGRGGVPADRLGLLPFYADEQFFDAAATPSRLGESGRRPTVLAVGRQHRDFLLLVDIAPRLGADVLVAVGSLYSKSPDLLAGRPLPDNVRVVTLTYEQLRQAYADAAVVVLPTSEEDFNPGLTALLEAMSMGCPVVVSRAEGSGDYVADRRAVLRAAGLARTTSGVVGQHLGVSDQAAGPHGLYVPVADGEALLAAITYLLEHPDEAREMGRRGRSLIEEGLTLDHFVARLTGHVRSSVAAAPRPPAA